VQYHRLRKEVRIAVPRLFPYGTAGEWIVDLNRTRLQEEPAWTSTDRTIGGYLYWDGDEATVGDRGRLFSWSDTIGKLHEETVGTTADGSDMVCEYEGPTFTTALNMARFLELYGEFQPSPGVFSVEVQIDGVGVTTQTVSIGTALALFDVALFDVDVFAGAGRKPFVLTLPLRAEGRSILVKGTYTGQGMFRWYTYAPALISEPGPRGL